ncbi:MAG: hypothetical protein ACLRSW_03700, partial [Christensenellaceae bacterium]
SMDNVNNVFARGTYCDVMILNDSMPNYTGTYPGGVEKGISDGKIIDISDKMEEMAPNYYSLVENDPDVKQDVITDDGRLTRFYEIANKESDSGYMMRQDWLKNRLYRGRNHDGEVNSRPMRIGRPFTGFKVD